MISVVAPAPITPLLGEREPPTAAAIQQVFASRASAIEHGNSQLTYPAWAKGTHGLGDVYLTLSGDVEGLALWDDSRGWGAYAELAIARGTLGELAPILGETRRVPPNPGGREGPVYSAYLPRGGKTVRVFVELRRGEAQDVRRVTIHFQT